MKSWTARLTRAELPLRDLERRWFVGQQDDVTRRLHAGMAIAGWLLPLTEEDQRVPCPRTEPEPVAPGEWPPLALLADNELRGYLAAWALAYLQAAAPYFGTVSGMARFLADQRELLGQDRLDDLALERLLQRTPDPELAAMARAAEETSR